MNATASGRPIALPSFDRYRGAISAFELADPSAAQPDLSPKLGLGEPTSPARGLEIRPSVPAIDLASLAPSTSTLVRLA